MHQPTEESRGRQQQRQAQCALCVMSCLLLMLGIMMDRLFFIPLHPGSPDPTPRESDDNAKANKDQDQASATGKSFGVGGCVWPGSGWITGVLMTSDDRLVLSNWHSQALMVMKPSPAASAAEASHIPLEVRPLGMALVGDFKGRVAVTSGSAEVVLVNLNRIRGFSLQRVATRKRYYAVTSGLNETTLIVSSLAEGRGQVSIDVITLRGEVVRTLMETARFDDLRFCHFLARMDGDVLVSTLDRKNESTLIRLHRPSAEGSEWEAEVWQDKLLSGHLWGTAGHEAWGVFIGQDDGVVLRTTEGRYVRVVNRTEPHFSPTALAVVRGDSLYVVWDQALVGDFVLVEYRLLRL